MAKITYTDKVALTPPTGDPANQWRDDDGNEVKDVVNENSEAVNDSTLPITFEKTGGTWVNSPATPLTTEIILSTVSAINGGCAGVWYNAATLDISGGTVVIQSGSFIADELCLVWFIYDKGSNGFIVNIQSGFTGDLPSDTILFQDTFNGTTISTTKWQITEGTWILTQNDELIATADETDGSGFDSSVRGQDGIDLSTIVAVTFDCKINNQLNGLWAIGLTKDAAPITNSDRITMIQQASPGTVGLSIREGGTNTSVDTVAMDLTSTKTIKLTNIGGTISLYWWDSSWTLLASGTHTSTGNWYPVVMGASDLSQPLTINVDNFYVHSEDIVTQYPV